MSQVQAPSIKALAFDVFGTVVDWRGSIIREGAEWQRDVGHPINWAQFADKWRAGYLPAMNRVRHAELPWMKLDDLHRLILDALLNEFEITNLSEQQKDQWNHVWHRLSPWPDTVEGLTRLRQRYLLATLSNGNVSLLAGMAKLSGLPWDIILSAEIFHHYKPDREVYLGAADLLGCNPSELMLVAAHPSDLDAARACGLRTAYIARPLEFGPDATARCVDTSAFDYSVSDLVELAVKLA